MRARLFGDGLALDNAPTNHMLSEAVICEIARAAASRDW